MSVTIWRDSVAAGGDVDAPHERVVRLAADSSVRTLVAKGIAAGYLPTIADGRATWILEGRRPIAVLAQQWTEPRWLVDPETSIAELRRESGRPQFQVVYWCQVDPRRVYASLRDGRRPPEPT
jgi:hypothetical protein